MFKINLDFLKIMLLTALIERVSYFVLFKIVQRYKTYKKRKVLLIKCPYLVIYE